METHLEALCGELRKSVDVRVLVANDHRGDDEAIVNGVAVSRLAIQMTIAGAPICPAMAWKIRRASSDIVHVHLPNPAGVIAALASGSGSHLIATWHSDVVRQRRLARVFEPIQRRFLRRCAAVIATSPDYVESSEPLNRMRDRCHVVPYGIDPSRYRKADEAEVREIRERFGERIVLAVGRLVYYKGFENLVRAAAKIDAKILMVGEGPLRPALLKEAHELGVDDRVVFLGEMQPSVIPYYHAADVFVLPSIARSEAFGIVQLEAMATGLPVVNTRIASGVPFVSRDGETGFTVPPGDSAALAHAINRLLDDRELRARFGHAARRRVESEFSLDAMVRRTREIYERVAYGNEHPQYRAHLVAD
ncbi:MAG TPA: glycosyltransferase [Candidatus Binataceae bacterium]|nr:glycosyltransferase [Candidatus Binataceae bacterium]